MQQYLITYGGQPKEDLLDILKENGIRLNDYAIELLETSRFEVSFNQKIAKLVILVVEELGLPKGATLNEIFTAAFNQGLALCPLEVAPYFRLSFSDDENSAGEKSLHKAPEYAFTIASKPVSSDATFPKGFYIRKIDNQSWLRGFLCDDLHIFSPKDKFVFLQK